MARESDGGGTSRTPSGGDPVPAERTTADVASTETSSILRPLPGTPGGPGTILRQVSDDDVAPPPPIGEVKETTWTPARSQEFVRSVLAFSLVFLLATVTVVPFVFVATKWVVITDMDTIMKIVFAPVVGLVGSVVGFYFGAEVASRNGGK